MSKELTFYCKNCNKIIKEKYIERGYSLSPKNYLELVSLTCPTCHTELGSAEEVKNDECFSLPLKN